MKYHEYLAKQYEISLEEAGQMSLTRALDLVRDQQVMALITASIQNVSCEKNIARNSMLGGDLLKTKFGLTPLYGYWTNGEEKIREGLFLVSASDKMSNKQLQSIVLGWMKKYQQESVIVKYKDSDLAYLLAADGTESSIGKWSVDRLAEIYRQMKKGTFVFEAADNLSWSAKLAIQTMERDDGKDSL